MCSCLVWWLLALIFYLWNKPHYRNGTFQEDMLQNLKDCAVPGTGIALKWFCYFKVTVLLYLLFVYPTVCLVAAVNAWTKGTHISLARVSWRTWIFREDLLRVGCSSSSSSSSSRCSCCSSCCCSISGTSCGGGGCHSSSCICDVRTSINNWWPLFVCLFVCLFLLTY